MRINVTPYEHPDYLRWIAAVVLLVALTVEAGAQSATIRGFVTDQSDGEALPGVNISLDDGSGRLRGIVSDGDGVYALSGIPAGQYVLRASFVGYQTYRDTLNLAGGQVYAVNLALAPGEAALDELVVESERAGGAARVTAGLQTIRPQEIELVPTPDVSGDLATYLTTLPSVVTLGDQGGQLFIRGGEPSHSMVLLDGMYVYQPFHILGFYSAFPTDILNRVDVHAGGYSSEFAGRISSVIDIWSRNGNKRRFSGSASVAPFVSSARFEGPLIRDRASFLASARQSVIAQGAERYINDDLPYTFGDFFAKLHVVASPDDQFSISALHTHDAGTLGEPTQDRVLDEVRWTNTAASFHYRFLAGTIPFMGELMLSVSRMRTELGPPGAPVRYSEFEGFNYAVNLTSFYGGIDWRYGMFWRANQFQSALGGLFQNIDFRLGRRHKAGLWIEPDLRFSNGLRIRPGLVGQLFPSPSTSPAFAEPRIRIIWERGRHEWSAAAGRFHQEVVGLNDRRDAANVFTAWKNAQRDVIARATHLIVGYRINPWSWLEASVEGFYNWMPTVLIGEWTAYPRFTTIAQEASGRARGVNLRVDLRWPRFQGFVTYGLSSVEYEAKQPTLGLWFGEETLKFRPPHDRRHQVNVVLSTNVRGFDVRARWNFGSGRPYNRVIGFDGFVYMHGVQDLFEVRDEQRVIYDRPFQGILPTYHRLDLSIDRVIEIRGARLTVQGSVINVYDRRNLLSLDLFTLRRTDQLPIVPTVGLKLEF